MQKVSSRVLGPENDVTMTSRHLRAIALYRLGRLAEAEAENRFVLNAWKRDNGTEDMSTLLSWGNLSHVLFDSGKLDEAEKEVRAVLDIRIRVLGPDHPDTQDSRSLLAHIKDDLHRPSAS